MTRYTQQAASAGYYGIFDRDMELSHAETVARLNELEERVAGLQEEIKIRNYWLEQASAALDKYRARFGPLSGE